MQHSETQPDKIDFLHKRVKTLSKNKLNEEEIIKELSKDGIDSFYAQTLIDNVNNDKSDNKNFWKLIFGGIFITISGLLINYLSHRIAENVNSMFFYLFWGIVATGLIMIMRAFIIFRR